MSGLEGITVDAIADVGRTAAAKTTAGLMGLQRIDDLPERRYTVVFIEAAEGRLSGGMPSRSP
jgi:hypothetical protein